MNGFRKPLPGLKAYRYAATHGRIHVQASDDGEALEKAGWLIGGSADPSRLERWDGAFYVNVIEAARCDEIGASEYLRERGR